jgi:hypothetical protein
MMLVYLIHVFGMKSDKKDGVQRMEKLFNQIGSFEPFFRVEFQRFGN